MSQITILYLNADGDGLCQRVPVAEGTTLVGFLENAGCSQEGNMILVNRQSECGDYVLEDQDRVSVTPLKVAGA